MRHAHVFWFAVDTSLSLLNLRLVPILRVVFWILIPTYGLLRLAKF